MTRMIRGKVVVEKKGAGEPIEKGGFASPKDTDSSLSTLESSATAESAIPVLPMSRPEDAPNPLRDGDTFAPPTAPWVGAEKAWRNGIVPPPHEEWKQYKKRMDKPADQTEDLTLTDIEVATVLSTLPPPSIQGKKEPSASHWLKYAATAGLTAIAAWAVFGAVSAPKDTASPKTPTMATAAVNAAILPAGLPEIKAVSSAETSADEATPPFDAALSFEMAEVPDPVASKPANRAKNTPPTPTSPKSAAVSADTADTTVTNPYGESPAVSSILVAAADSESTLPDLPADAAAARGETFDRANPYGTSGGSDVPASIDSESVMKNPDEGAPSLSREMVRTVMESIAPKVVECGNGTEQGKIVLRVTVAGATGRVKDAEALFAPYVNTPVGRCAARAVRHAKFPQFNEAELTIKYPFEF